MKQEICQYLIYKWMVFSQVDLQVWVTLSLENVVSPQSFHDPTRMVTNAHVEPFLVTFSLVTLRNCCGSKSDELPLARRLVPHIFSDFVQKLSWLIWCFDSCNCRIGLIRYFGGRFFFYFLPYCSSKIALEHLRYSTCYCLFSGILYVLEKLMFHAKIHWGLTKPGRSPKSKARNSKLIYHGISNYVYPYIYIDIMFFTVATGCFLCMNI